MAAEPHTSLPTPARAPSPRAHRRGLDGLTRPPAPGSFFLALALACAAPTTPAAPVPGYPTGVQKIEVTSSADQSRQPSLFWSPPDPAGPVPLLVALHTWSGTYAQAGGEAAYARWCQQVGWAFIHPHLRGPNNSPEAMGSDLVVSDALDAVRHATTLAPIDPDRIYLIGVSGGGHAALLLAGRAPDTWAAVSAWCPISDIAAWHDQCAGSRFAKYAANIESSLGAPPRSSPEAAADAARRSPLSWLKHARSLPLDIYHGIEDGRAGSVPFTHSLHAFNVLASPGHQLSAEQISAFYESRTPPAESPTPPAKPLLGTRQPIFQRTSGQARITIFQGGHEIVHQAALNWLAAQHKGREPNWSPEPIATLDAAAEDAASGR